MKTESVDNLALRYYALFTAGMTFVLVWIGGLVTSHNAGLSVPDWPNSYGYNMFFFPPSKWMGGILFEHSHRLIASLVGFLTLLLALWLFGRSARPALRGGAGLFLLAGIILCFALPARNSENIALALLGLAGVGASFFWPKCEPSARWIRVLGIIAFFTVAIQGVLGGLRVTRLDARLGIFHATLAQIFLVLICFIALSLSPAWRRLPWREGMDRFHVRAGFTGLTLLILAQLALGATMRHQHAGLAIPDFPTAYGKLWPSTTPQAVNHYNQTRQDFLGEQPITAAQIILQMVHRLMALVILLSITTLAWWTGRSLGRKHLLSRLALVWLGLIMLQVLLGAATIWTGKSADIATAHVACGALCLVCGSLSAAVAWRVLSSPGEPQTEKKELTSWAESSSIPSR